MEFSLILLIFPIVVIIASVIGYLLFRKWIVMPLLTFMVFAILMFTVFNESFLIWLVVNTILSMIVSLPMKFIKRLN